jgi:hypothetical protein
MYAQRLFFLYTPFSGHETGFIVSCGPSLQVEHTDLWSHMHSEKGRHTTAFCVLVGTGDFYLGEESSSSRTFAHPARSQVPQGYNQKSSHIALPLE